MPNLTFSTEEKRQEHPEIRFIPESIWNSAFDDGISEFEQSVLIAPTLAHVESILDQNLEILSDLEKIQRLVFVLCCHQNMNATDVTKIINRISSLGRMPPWTIEFAFDIAVAKLDRELLQQLILLSHDKSFIAGFTYNILDNSIKNKDQSTINFLLSIPEVLSTTKGYKKYNHYVTSFAKEKIAELRHLRSQFEEQHHDNSFDITDPNEISTCFNLLNCLLRFDDDLLLDEIDFLIEIQSVRALVRESEEKLIKEFQEKERLLSLEDVLLLPLGSLSYEFCFNPIVEVEARNESTEQYGQLLFRINIEKYLHTNDKQFLEAAELAIQELTHYPLVSRNKQNRKAGIYLLPISRNLVRQAYESNNPLLIQLFQKHFPIPRASLLSSNKIPDVIREREQEISETIQKVAIKTLEPFIIKAQRRLRLKRRQREEIFRTAQIHEDYLHREHLGREKYEARFERHDNHYTRVDKTIDPNINMWAEELLKDANTPYRPKCDALLADRIMSAARKVSAFSTIKHITSQSALKSIFDEALYGRKALLDFYLIFNPASLAPGDVLNGDANVVCCGPQAIDPKASGNIVLEFNLNKVLKSKPAAFFKQQDLQYRLDKKRQVRLGEGIITFDHTTAGKDGPTIEFHKALRPHSEYAGASKLFTVCGHWDPLHSSTPATSFIAYDLDKIHEILTLNFFRCIDKLYSFGTGLPGGTAFTKQVYSNLSELTDEELVNFLTDVEKNLTDTAEFNFYGAHKIDFSTLASISDRRNGYTIRFPEFIMASNIGNIDTLRMARRMIPELFQSYRFLDYLLSNVHHPEVRYYLDDVRKICQTPEWISYTPLEIPEGYEIHWDPVEIAPIEAISKKR